RDTLVSEALVAPLQTATGLLLRLSSFCSWRCRLSALVGLATFDVMGSATCYREGFSFLQLKPRPRIGFTIRSSVEGVNPQPTPKFTSHCGAMFKSTQGKICCCWSLRGSGFPMGPSDP